jgi:hypothetical protein
MAKKSRKARVGKATANGKRLPKRNASAAVKGAAYAVLAGRDTRLEDSPIPGGDIFTLPLG